MSTLSGGPNIVTDGLVLYLDAANPASYVSGSTAWNDISRGGNNGTLVNGPTFDSTNGGSIVFDGINDYTTIPDSPALKLNGNFTIMLWHRGITKTNTFPGPLYKGNSGAGGTGYILFYTSVNNGEMYLKRGNIQLSMNNAVNTYWSHITFTYDGTNVRGYLNGVFSYISSTVTYPTNVDGSSLLLGRADQSGNAAIGTIQMYSRALSAQESLQNYNSTKGRFGL
jgi:hypothetical protein